MWTPTKDEADVLKTFGFEEQYLNATYEDSGLIATGCFINTKTCMQVIPECYGYLSPPSDRVVLMPLRQPFDTNRIRTVGTFNDIINKLKNDELLPNSEG